MIISLLYQIIIRYFYIRLLYYINYYIRLYQIIINIYGIIMSKIWLMFVLYIFAVYLL